MKATGLGIRNVIFVSVLCSVSLWAFSCSGSAMPKEGNRAPDFKLKAQDGAEVQLSDLLKKGFVVLYFYPKDDTPGCKKEACSFRDLNQEFRSAGAEIIGISVDDLESHKKFHEKYHLTFTILADPDKKVTALYGVKSGLGMAKRVTFVIDGKGTIQKIYPDVDVTVHAQEVLAFIKSLQKK
jgi:thioredoxin-dependent peroxiredoxin